jgi:hypothetical protein
MVQRASHEWADRRVLLCVAATVALALLLVGCASSVPRRDPTGERFPVVNGKALDGREVQLPTVGSGQPLLLLIGYEQSTQFDLDRWIMGISDSGLAVKTYEVPTIPGLVPGMFSGWIDGGMRRGIPREDWGGVVTLYADGRRVAEFTGNQDGLPGRIVLLDRSGVVVFFHDRGYSLQSLQKLRDALARLEVETPSSASQPQPR